MKWKLFAASLVAGLGIQTAIAAPQPAKCPGIASIKDWGINEIMIQVNNAWFGGRRDLTYDTTNHWTFVIGNVRAQNARQAYRRARRALETIRFQAGPLPGPFGRWVCMYNTSTGYPAITVSPAFATISDAIQLVP